MDYYEDGQELDVCRLGPFLDRTNKFFDLFNRKSKYARKQQRDRK